MLQPWPAWHGQGAIWQSVIGRVGHIHDCWECFPIVMRGSGLVSWPLTQAKVRLVSARKRHVPACLSTRIPGSFVGRGDHFHLLVGPAGRCDHERKKQKETKHGQGSLARKAIIAAATDAVRQSHVVAKHLRLNLF
jgi:hypothetical protein